MGIRMIYAGMDSAYGFQSSVLRKIDARMPFETCILIHKSQDDKDIFEDPKYIVLNYDMCEHNRYEEYCDFNDLIPLSRDIVEKMRPYEGTAMHMLVRNTEHEVYTYEESLRLYLMQLRFWNHMIDSYGINFFVMNEVPHHTHHYIIYALCKIKGIVINLNISTAILYHWISGDDIYGQGERIFQRYLQIVEENNDIVLADDLEHIYQSYQICNRGLDDNLVHGGVTRKQHIAEQRKVFMEFVKFTGKWRRNLKRLKHGLAVKLKSGDGSVWIKQYQDVKDDLYYVKRAKLKMKILRGNRYYEKLTQPVNWDQKYVIYFLHYQPEATTLPRAGVFAEQIMAVQILAKSLENTGVKLLVKEHFVQPYRHKSFYDDLFNTRNVQLVSCDVDSKELLVHCVAAATCTGTVIQEALVNRKHILVFGDGGFTRGPGIHPVSSVEECRHILQDIMMEKESISDYQIRAYFKAIELETVFMHPYINELDEHDIETLEKNRASFVDSAIMAMQKVKDKRLYM